jgi:lipoprotein-anchoring transpeptidase ErfK/SrfK
VAVTAIEVLGGFGVVPSGPQDASAASGSIAPSSSGDDRTDRRASNDDDGRQSSPARQASVVRSEPVRPAKSGREVDVPALPAGSGNGRRVVFSEGQQRVWLVSDAGDVLRTYLVSGSIYENLDPGTYAVFSRSRWAVGIDDSGTMEYFVRFTYGDAGAAIGFHSIPVDDGAPVQTTRQLGTPLSHGCVRQRTSDAVALWEFAPIGTTVVVTA